MNKKAQTGPIGAIILFIFFLINWFVWLGAWLNTVGQNTIAAHSLTGIEAFFFSNLNFTVFICMILGLMGYMYLGSQ